jgi:hypothetical protein
LHFELELNMYTFIGCSEHVLDEAERSLHDVLCVLSQSVNDTRVVFGGGWPEMVMAKEVDELARKTLGKKSHAIDYFSRALQAIPTIIADNAGLDSSELISQLRAEHHKENSAAGIDVISGSISSQIHQNQCHIGFMQSLKLVIPCDAGWGHAKAGDIRVIQGEASHPTLCDTGGGDDSQGGRYHNLRPTPKRG